MTVNSLNGFCRWTRNKIIARDNHGDEKNYTAKAYAQFPRWNGGKQF